MGYALIAIVLAAVAGLIVALNIWHRRFLKTMTPKERKAWNDDPDTKRIEGDW